VVVLDDAHWCDAASAQVLEHLIDGPVGSRIKLVLTALERDLGRGHPVSRAIADLRRTRELIEVRLDGLDDRGLVSLVAARVGRAITPAVASRLCARTAGNPFFAGELARELEQSGGLRDGDALEQAPVPDAVAGLVHERLARLSPETEQLLVAAAAIGPSAPVALAANAAGIPADQAEQAVGEAIGERLVDRVAAAEPTISFPHALVRESFEALVDDAERARLHLAVALELERRPQPEPAELARHFGLAAPVAGSERAISAYREAATAAANAHDHERAAAHLRSAIALIPAASISERAPLLLELGDQQLLAADLAHARDAYRAAADAFRGTGDACGLAAAALGFAGGDIGFGYELDNDDPTMMVLLREALDALGDSDPNLSVRLIFRLLYAMAYEDESAPRAELVAQARSFAERAGDPESLFFAKGARLIAEVGRTSEPTRVLDLIDHIELLLAEAEHVGRDDVLLRMLRLAAWASYCCRRIERCEQLIERMAIVADKLGTPRFTWEVDQARAERLTDRGERAQALGLVERAGATLRRLRPDLHLAIELTILAWSSAIYDDQISTSLAATESMGAATPWGMISAYATWWLALNGEHDAARDRLAELCAAEFETIRRPDIQFPTGLALLALAAAIVGDRETGNRLRPLLEPSRQYMLNGAPALFGGFLAVHALGRLALLAGDLDAAIDDLQTAVEWSDSVGSRVNSSWTRIDLAGAQHQRGDRAGAIETLAAAEQLASEYGMGLLIRLAREARDELEGRPVAPAAAPGGRARPVRALAARTGRRALAAFVRDQDDAALEARFAPARRQRALLRAMTRGFQPAAALGFTGVIAYELEPYAIESPPDAPWRWAIEVGKDGASVLEPAPLDAAVTIHFSLADWVRVMAGTQDPVTTMAAGRGSVEGDVLVASRLQPMFGAR
jgi:tetratricopeptide (TPR) repeat protein